MLSFIRKNRKLTLLFLIALVTSFFLVSFAKDNRVQDGEYSYFNVLQSSEGYSNVYAVKSEYHKDKYISHFEVTGATKENENVFGKGKEKISVYHVLDVEIDDLWGSGNRIDYDSWNEDIYGADFDNQKIGLGAVYTLFTYYDNNGNPEYEANYETDFLANQNKGEPYLLFTIDDYVIKECDISILLFYKVSNGIGSWSDYFRVNFDFSVRRDSTALNFKTIPPEEQFEDEIPAQNVGVDIANNSYVFNGFYVDYRGNQFYNTTVYRNNVYVGAYNFITIQYVSFSQEGNYEIINKNAFSDIEIFYLTVDRHKPEGVFLNIDYNYIFPGWTRFVLNNPKDYENRSPVTVEISYNAGEFLPYSGEFLQGLGDYIISISNAFYTRDYYFTIVEPIIPDFNYRELVSLSGALMPTKFLAVEEPSGQYRLFSENGGAEAYSYALYLADLALDINDYVSLKEYTDAANEYAENLISVKYYDYNNFNQYVFDESIITGDTLYLNNFMFKDDGGPLYSNKVYYLRQEDYPHINTLDLFTALQFASIFKYNQPVCEQLTMSGTYLILDTNIYGQGYHFKAIYAAQNETVIDINYSFNGLNRSLVVTSDMSGQAVITPEGEYNFSGTVDKFSLESIKNLYDKYAVIKISLENSCMTDYYIASDDLNKIYSEATTGAGVYLMECYDRNGFYFSFEIIVRVPYDNQVIFEYNNQDLEVEGNLVIFLPKTWIVYVSKDGFEITCEVIENDDTYMDMNCIYFDYDPGVTYKFYFYDEFMNIYNAFIVQILVK